MALREFGFFWFPLPPVLAFAGFVDAFKRDRTTFWFLLTIVIADLAYALSYEIAEDKDAYYLPTFISIAISAGIGVRWLIRSVVSRSLAVFVQNLKEWEADPGVFARSPVLTQRISAAFLEMIQSIVTNESKIAPVYMTNDLLSSDSVNGELTRWLTQKYQLVPQGLVFNLAADRNFHDLPDVRLQTRGLADGTLRFEKDDVVKIKVLPAYTRMLTNRGRYLELFNQHDRAAAAFREALALDPGLASAAQGLADSTAKLRNQ